MVETSKQVRVDNWGIYFLQRLQLFFSKTDFCDLTLQFEGNVQLKVHRLVMNACTEYFAFLEQTCPALEENTILMPTDLQADVIVPIVNFMYTGMLEFHPSIFEKLYKAADTMNIAVLTKLLEAQLHKYKCKPRKEIPQSWGAGLKTSNIAKKIQKSLPVANELPSTLPGKKLPIWRKRQTPQPLAHPVSATFSNTKWNSDPPEKDPLMLVDNTPKPTRFEWPDDDQPPFSLDPSFDDVSLTSKPLWTREDEQKAVPSFEEARSLAQKSRHPASKNNSISQDAEDDFLQKEQKVNVSQLDESLSLSGENSLKRKAENKATSSPKRVKITNQDDETIISIKTSNPSELDHTKIVSEILKKYPDLVKKKKNIKLKITSTKNEAPQIKLQSVTEKAKPERISPVEKPPQPSPVKKEIKTEPTPTTQKEPAYNNTYNRKSRLRTKADFRAASEEGPWTCMECLGDGEAPEFVLYYLFRKHMTDVHHMEFNNSLCKYCGKKCPSENSMAYHLFTKHGLRPPANIKFPQCTTCPFIGVSTDKLQEHMKKHGKEEAQCVNCKLGFSSSKDLLNHHQITVHNNRSALSILDCAYCVKKLQSPVSLFMHVRTQHLKEARRDGVTSLDEIMDVEVEAENETTESGRGEVASPPEKVEEIVINRIEEKQQQLIKERVNIISNVKVTTRQEESSSDNVVTTVVEPPAISETQPVAVTTTAAALSTIGGSLTTNLGLVDIVVLDDNQQYILQQPQGQGGNAEFILPELTGNEGILQAASAAADLNSTDELVMVLTDHDYQDEQSQGQSDNSNIVVLYSHPVEGQQGQFITSQGNILVNSQGLLEIRNGAGITTTAGQILVSDTTTTTQAIESPIESIELIRKEIEGSVSEQEDEKESIKDILRKRVLEKDVEKEGVKDANEERSTKNLENGTSNELLDTIDSSIQEEPMEVDEIGPQQTDQNHGEVEENQSVNSSTDIPEPEAIDDEANNEEANNEEAGQDVPPEFTKEPEKTLNAEEAANSKLNISSNEVISNDPSEFHQNFEREEEDSHLPAEDEPMEVDGGKVDESNEQIEGDDQVDNDQVPSNVENHTEEDHSLQEHVPDALEHQEKADLPEQDPLLDPLSQNDENPSIDGNQEPSAENDLIPSRDSIQDRSTENDQESNIVNDEESSIANDQEPVVDGQELNMIHDQEPSMVHDQEPSMVHDQEPSIVHEEPTAENDQGLSLENDHGASMESDRNTDNDHNDQNDNIQPNFDDFTDESQQSSGQKVHRDLNKEILDDWDDTDSQQSHSHEQESQEEVQDQAAINAAENVNKLMDDWDEEDEDQSKE